MGLPLSTFEVVLNGFLVLLTPIVITSVLAGSPPPEFGALKKYYIAEPWLNVVGNLFLLTICAQSFARLAGHFGLIDDAAVAWPATPLGALFAILFFAFAGLWLKAYLKLRRQNGSA